MNLGKVLPAIRTGRWALDGHDYRIHAQLALKKSEETRVSMDRKLARLKKLEKPANQDTFPLEIVHEYGLLYSASIVFAAMAVEGFLNYYGVRRFGDDFYRRNYERLSAAQKVSAIVATCIGSLLPDDAEVLTVVRRLFEARNALVHPKVRELKPSGAPTQSHGTSRHVDSGRDSVRDMERFFELFAELDPEATALLSE